MIKSLFLVALIAIPGLATATPTPEQPDRNISEYNPFDGKTQYGFDPVSYFEGEPLEGLNEIQGEYGGLTYFFASEENKETFLSNPTKFEPTYGGWCAWAMVNGITIDIDPNLYTISGDRIHFFVNRGAKARFDRDIDGNSATADSNWEDISGELPRL